MTRQEEIKTLPLAELVTDFSIYPRHAVDGQHVSALVESYEAGATFPPITVDRDSKRIVDGWHRARMYERVLGPGASVEVRLVKFRDEADLRMEAVRANAIHGRRIDANDYIRCVHMLRACDVDDEKIAGALSITVARVQTLAVKIAVVPKSSPVVIPGTVVIPLRQAHVWKAGQRLTKEQAEVAARAMGVKYRVMARKIIDGLNADMVDLSDKYELTALKDLRDCLVEKLPA